MKLKPIILLSLLASLPLSSYAAKELTPEEANALKPFKQIVVRDSFSNHSDAVKEVSKAADRNGAYSFYINNIGYHSRNDALWIVHAYLYSQDAPQAEEPKFREFHGVIEYPKKKAFHLEPFDQIVIYDQFSTPYDLNEAVGREAEKHGAYAFYIHQKYEIKNKIKVVAYLFKEDAPERVIQNEEYDEGLIPYDSEAGQAALAQGGEAAKMVENPQAQSSTEFNSKRKRYSVTLPGNIKVEELNRQTAEKMQPFDSIRFRGTYSSPSEISRAAAKKAAEKGAKYYFISRKVDDRGNGNYTLYVDLYK